MKDDMLLRELKSEAAMIDAVIKDDLQEVNNPQLFDILKYCLLSGGKRIRPLLAILAARLCLKGQTSSEALSGADLYKLAISFEYLHAASLLHDDVIDHADSRRGRPSANTVWGVTPVILAGDYLHSRAMFLAGTIGNKRVLAQISKAAAAMVESEFIQMNSVQSKDCSEKSYFNVLNGKTAALIAAACEAGGLYVQGGEKKVEALQIFGNNLGLAFQIVDDLLDYQGDSEKTGKAIGNDFVEGKMTLPLIHTIETCNETERQQLLELLEKTPDERKMALNNVRQIIAETGGFAYAKIQAENLVTEASDGLELFPACKEKETLLGLGHYVLTREK